MQLRCVEQMKVKYVVNLRHFLNGNSCKTSSIVKVMN